MHIRLLPQSSRLKKKAKAAILACLLGPGLAMAACVVPAGVPDDSQIDRLVDELPQCQRDASFLAALGNVLNKKGRYAEASDHLERALMLAPDLKGAKLDYAISLAGTGDTPAAGALLDDLLADPTVPAQLRTAMEQQRAEWAGTNWRTRLLLSGRIGHDSNLLGAPNLSFLTLTFPGQSVLLPLDASAQARSGSYGRVDLQLEAQKRTAAGGEFEGFLSLRSRRSSVVPEADSQQVDAVVEHSTYQRRAGSSGFYASASASLLDAALGIRYNAYGLNAGIGNSRWVPGCDVRSGLELQERKFLSNDLLSGRYSGISGSIACERRDLQWLLSAKAGIDKAHNADRAGGDQTQYSLRAAVVTPAFGPKVLARGQLSTDIEFSESRDHSGFSALLESGRLRVIHRASGRVEYQYPLSSHLQGIAGAELVVQRSSLALFANRSWGPYLALRSAW
jgi:hypothetical protein